MFVLLCVLVYAAELSTADETIYGNDISNRKHVPCTRPQHPAHGRYTTYPPGAPGSNSSYLQMNATCDDYYHLAGAPSMACVSGTWSHPRPECFPLCREEEPSGVVSCPGRAEHCLLHAFSDMTSESSTFYDYEETTDTSSDPSTLYPFTGTCVLPAQLKHGSYESTPRGKPGDYKQFFVVTVTCDPDYVLFGSKFVNCMRGTWSDEMPQCIPYCARETEQGVVTCGAHEKRCMRRKSNIDFQEGCGYLNNNLFTNERTSIPWIAGLYVKNEWIFGTGTLISKRVILTSATNFRTRRAHLFREYLVAVGNITPNVSDISNVDSQTSDINDIIMHPEYTGESTKYRHNLALVVAANEFQYNDFIRPVCLNFDPAFNEDLLQKTIRREVQMISWDSCIRTEHPKYITPSEYRTRMPEIAHDLQDEVICVEDVELCYAGKGAGLVIEAVISGMPRYILRGVSSEFLLYRKNVSLFTDILNYNQFIKSALGL